MFSITLIGQDTRGSPRVSSWTPFFQPVYADIGSNHVDYTLTIIGIQMTQYTAVSPDDYSIVALMCHCLEQINNWMNQKFLHLNKTKTEIIVFGSK